MSIIQALSAETPTDAEGRFRFSNLDKKAYSLSLDRAKILNSEPSSVKGGQAAAVVLRAELY